MVNNKKEPTFEFQNWFGGGDIFYRKVDKQRFQYALDAVVDDGLGLAVIGNNETVLDHYCRMLVARLRDLNIFQVEVFLPTNTDSLLKRFNEMLASMSMERARQAADPAEPVKLLVVNDAKAVDEEQWSLLVRLLADFPGVNARLVLFLDKTGWPGYEKILGLFGRRLYRWAVETPTLDEAAQLMLAAKEHGFEGETETLLLHAGLAAAVQGGYSEEDPDEYSSFPLPPVDENDYIDEGYSDSNPFAETDTDFLDEEDPSYDPDDPKPKPKPKASKLWPVAAIFLVSLALTWGVISKLNPDAVGQYEASVSDALNELADTSKNAQISEPLTLPLDAGERQVNRSGNPTSGKPVVASQIVEAQAVVAALQKDKLSEQQAAIEKRAAQKKAAQVRAAQQAATAKKAAVLERATAIKKAKISAPVQSARATDFFVQHIVLSTSEQAGLYIKRYAGLRKAIIVPIATDNNVAYAVLSGPFSTRDRASVFAQGRGLPADYWIRTAQQLKTIVRN